MQPVEVLRLVVCALASSSAAIIVGMTLFRLWGWQQRIPIFEGPPAEAQDGVPTGTGARLRRLLEDIHRTAAAQ